MRTLALVSCVAAASVGATVAVDAATSAGSKSSPHRAGSRHPGLRHLGARRVLRRVVHADLVVARRDGTFPTITIDRGRIGAVSGSTVSLVEGTAKATYKSVDIALPAGAVVRVNGRRASAAELKPGMRARVLQAPRRTVVRARS
jgi:hypothetical protein